MKTKLGKESFAYVLRFKSALHSTRYVLYTVRYWYSSVDVLSDHVLWARQVMRVFPDVGLSTVAGPPLTLGTAPVLCDLIYQELTSRPDNNKQQTKVVFVFWQQW